MQLAEWLTTGGGSPPFDYVMGELCRYWHCLPGQLHHEDYGELWRIMHYQDVAARMLKDRGDA